MKRRMSLDVKYGVILITEEDARATIEIFNTKSERTHEIRVECDLMSNAYLIRMFRGISFLNVAEANDLMKAIRKLEVA